MAHPETTHLTSDGIHCDVTGSGTPVVLTHDGLLHRESWDAQIERFATLFRAVRWDRRGYGRTARPAEPYSSVADLAAVVRSTSDGPAALVGSSFGGYFSLQCALDHPELVAALVLVGPVITGLPLSQHFLTRAGRLPAPDTAAEAQIAYWSETDPWYAAASSTTARARVRELLTACPQNLRPPLELERPAEQPALPRLGEIAVPTLIVTGEHDIPDVHAHSGAIEAGIPGARRVVLAGSGHVPHLEVPDAFNQVVVDFLMAHLAP
jgi:pimeloyl-ACP methyl ester carboxylesterase